VQLDAATTERLHRLLQGDLDWEYVLHMASQHWIMPFLFWHLRAVDSQAVPQGTLNVLREHFYDNAGHNLLLTGELLKLLKLFNQHGIAAIPYKGPALAAFVYENLSLREITDLDILVHRQDMLKVKKLMLSHGYRREYPDCQFTPRQELAFIHSPVAFHYIFRNEEESIEVEIHWELRAPNFDYPLPLEPLWSRLQPISLVGTTVLGFAPEDLLVLLCLHGAKHHWSNLEWVCGVAELLRVHVDMDWQQIMICAGTADARRIVRLGLLLARDLLDAPLSPAILREARSDKVARVLAAQVQEKLFQESAPLSLASQFRASMNSFRFYIQLKESWSGKLSSVRQYARLLTYPNPVDLAFLPLPPSLYFLYHLVRPWRLFSKYAGSSLQHILPGRR
jgi:hypothetical protein